MGFRITSDLMRSDVRNLGFPVLVLVRVRVRGAGGYNGVDLYTNAGGVARGVGISLVVSSYLDHSGARFHLHPGLADESGGESAV